MGQAPLSEEPQEMTNEALAFLPPFVRAKVQMLADWYEKDTFVYHERSGSIARPPVAGQRVHFWIAGDDEIRHWLYLGGSACWLEASNHFLHFDPIPADLLPSPPDSRTWWAIHNQEGKRGLQVYKITLVEATEVTSDWKDF